MEWNVYRVNLNRKEFEVFNIFDHCRFREDIQKALKQHECKADFAESARKDLMYYFWCKSEYELVLTPWIGSSRIKDKKVDIYGQVMLNWDKFVDYCWSFKDEKVIL